MMRDGGNTWRHRRVQAVDKQLEPPSCRSDNILHFSAEMVTSRCSSYLAVLRCMTAGADKRRGVKRVWMDLCKL
jgi:hypothetical protein